MILNLVNLDISVAGKTLISGINARINEGQRFGLIGPNGAGKTTLLNTIAGQRSAEKGAIESISDCSIGYLKQEILELNVNKTVREFAAEAFAEIKLMEEKLDHLAHKLSDIEDYESNEYHKVLEDMQHVQARIDNLEGNKVEGKIERVLTGLGFPRTKVDRPLKEFSGGWRMRAAIAKLLLESPDVLLLDEPTNHLDIDSISWLENYLIGYPGAIIIVSHDRFFLDKMVNHILEIRAASLNVYTGNYSDYEKQVEEELELQKSRFDGQQKKIAETERFIERFRYKATKAKAVQSRIKQLEKLDRVENPEFSVPEMNFTFPDPPRAGKSIIEISNLKKTYHSTAGDVQVFDSNQQLYISRGSKIALIGPNGAGKSTFARICRGSEPFEGERKLGHNVLMGFFAQHLADELPDDVNVLQAMEAAAKTTDARKNVRNLLGAFLFSGDDVEKPVSVLSGGERSRLALARILLEPVNFLVLDEPTNHLDMVSKEILAKALKEYPGTVLIISHDRHFISSFADQMWRAEGGRITIYEGGYDYYQWKTREEKQAEVEEQNGSAKSKPDQSKEKKDYEKAKELRRQKNKLQSKIKTLENDLAKVQSQKKEIETFLAAPEAFLMDDFTQQTEYYAELKEKEADLEESWLEFSSRLEQFKSDL